MAMGGFITLEGVDGCGKSTQAKLLAEYLEEKGFPVILTREPGGTPLAEEIRKVILTPSDEELDPLAEILLYAASRAQHVNRFIKPALKEGKYIICERFIHSSLAYQGYGLGWDLELIKNINRLAIGDFQPDLAILLDQGTEQSNRRMINRSNTNQQKIDRIESRGFEFLEQVRQGFLKMAELDGTIAMIDIAGKGIREVHSEIVTLLKSKGLITE